MSASFEMMSSEKIIILFPRLRLTESRLSGQDHTSLSRWTDQFYLCNLCCIQIPLFSSNYFRDAVFVSPSSKQPFTVDDSHRALATCHCDVTSFLTSVEAEVLTRSSWALPVSPLNLLSFLEVIYGYRECHSMKKSRTRLTTPMTS